MVFAPHVQDGSLPFGLRSLHFSHLLEVYTGGLMQPPHQGGLMQPLLCIRVLYIYNCCCTRKTGVNALVFKRTVGKHEEQKNDYCYFTGPHVLEQICYGWIC